MNQILTQAQESPNCDLLKHSYFRLLKTQLHELGVDTDLRWSRTLAQLQPILPTDPQNEEVEERKAEWVEFYVTAINSEYVAIGELPDVTSCENLTPVACNFPLFGTIDDGVTSSST